MLSNVVLLFVEEFSMSLDRPAALALLGLPGGATRAEITRAYHRLARRTHPDVSAEPEAAVRFARLNSAYRTAFATAPTAADAPPPSTRRAAPHARGADSAELRVGPVHYTPWPTTPGGSTRCS